MKNISIALFACILLSFSCEKKTPDTSKNTKETNTETVKKETDAIVDSLNASWTDLVKTEDQKFKDIKRLLEEISYTSSYDVVAVDSLVKKTDKVKSMIFNESLDTNAID